MKNHLRTKISNSHYLFNNRLLFFLFLFFFFNVTHSQSIITISGKVIDSLSQPIESVTVILFDSEDRYISNFRTHKNGVFQFKIIPYKKQYTLKFKSLAYKTDAIVIKLLDDKIKYEFNVLMQTNITHLNEVVLEAESNVKIKKDTISYRASNFTNRNNNVLEDLLKNLPGIQVDQDGTVKVNGRSINKLLIGGDDVFGQNYKIATKNIDVNDIEEIDILYNYNENSVLRAILESEEIAINVDIKEEKLGNVYGKGSLGYGNDNNYLADLTLFKLNKKLKTFLIGKANSVGNRAQNNLNSSMFNRNSSVTLGKYQSFSKNIISTDLVVTNALLDEAYVNDNKSFFNSLHTLTKPKKNLHLRGAFYYLNDNISKKNSFSVNYKTPPTFSINQSKVHKDDLKEFNLELNLKKSNGSKTYIEYDGIVNNLKQVTDVDLSIDENQLDENLRIKDFYISQRLNVTFKIDKKNAIMFSAFYVQDKNPQTYYTNNPIINGQEFVLQKYENPIRHFGIFSKLYNKKGQWNFAFINKDEELNSQVFGSDNEVIQLNNFNLTNRLKYNSKFFFVFRKYDFSLGNNLNLSVNAEIGYNFVSFKDKSHSPEVNEFNSQVYIAPELKLSKEFVNFGKVNLDYEYSLKQPEIIDINKGLLLTSNRGFTQGFNSIFNLYSHRLNLLYSKSDFRKNVFITSSLGYNFNQNTFGYKYINSPDFDLLVKEKADNNSVLTSSFELNKNVSAIKSGFFFKYGGLYRRSFVRITNDIEIAKNTTNNLIFKYGTYFRGKLNFKSGLKYQYSKFKTKTISNKNTQFSSYFQLIYDISEKSVFTLDSKQIYPSKYNGIDKLYYLIDFEFKYLAIKNKLDIRLKGQNLANEREFQNNFVTLISDTESNIFLNKIFFNLSVSFRF